MAACACFASIIPDTTMLTPNVIAKPIPNVTSYGCTVIKFMILDFTDIQMSKPNQ
jgi:hypothetical protein